VHDLGLHTLLLENLEGDPSRINQMCLREKANILEATSRAIENQVPHDPALRGADSQSKGPEVSVLKPQQMNFLKSSDKLK
jgi:hypothetical protein